MANLQESVMHVLSSPPPKKKKCRESESIQYSADGTRLISKCFQITVDVLYPLQS